MTEADRRDQAKRDRAKLRKAVREVARLRHQVYSLASGAILARRVLLLLPVPRPDARPPGYEAAVGWLEMGLTEADRALKAEARTNVDGVYGPDSTSPSPARRASAASPPALPGRNYR